MRRRGAAGRGRGGARQNSRGGANKASAADAKKTQKKDEDNEINEEEVESAENNPSSLQFSYGTDKKAELGFCTYYRDLEKDKPKELVRFFERKNGPSTYHTVHGDDAIFIANDYYHTTDALAYLGGEPGKGGLPSQAISPSLFVDIIRDLLLNKRYRVEVYACPSSVTRGAQNWQVVKKASPGNTSDFEDLMFHDESGASMTENNVTLALYFAIKDGQRIVGAAFADLNSRTFNVCEFMDDDHLSNVESLIMQTGAKECLLVEEDGTETQRILTVLEACNVLDTPMRKSSFSTQHLEQDLATLLVSPPAQHNYDELQMQYAMACTACLIQYFELLSDINTFNKYRLQRYNFSQFMRLDRTAFVALNLVPDPREKRSMNLFSLLNHCRTAMGSRRLMQSIKQPLINIDDIQQRQNIVETFVEDSELRKTMQKEHLKRMPDVNRLMRKITKNSNAGLQDILRLYQFVQKLSGMYMAFDNATGTHKELITERYQKPFEELIEIFKQFEAMVETMVDLSLIDQHEYRIRPDFDEELKEMYDQIKRTKQQIQDVHLEVADEIGVDPKDLKLENTRQMGYYFRLTAKNEKHIRNNKEFTRIENQRKDGVKFRNSALHRLNEKYKKLNSSYDSRQQQIVTNVVATTGTYQQPMEQAAEIVAEIDVFVSMAYVSANWGYVRPELCEPGTGDIVIKESRHPCLETQDQIAFISNDVNLIRDKSMLQLITGPNMGGKSTYIRQVAMIVLMAQMGCFVPASSATISIVDAILVRVGAGDSQLRGISTFMAEMLETSSILRSASSKSLICIDELGRGTSTYDGFGLAWAICQHIATRIKGFCLFATHFHELTALADEITTVSNLHVTAESNLNSKGLTFLYQVREGACDQSFGIHVAEMTNFPESIIQVAKRKAIELESFENVMMIDKEEEEQEEEKEEKKNSLMPSKKLRLSAAALQGEELQRTASEIMKRFHGLPLGDGRMAKAEAVEKLTQLKAFIDEKKSSDPQLAAMLLA